MRCLALFTGGLDAQLAVRMMQRQGLEVVGLFVQTPFTVGAETARAAAARLQIELLVESWKEEEYLAIVRRPRFGYAEEMAPCLDCRIGMLQRARARLESSSASFLVSGEVIGQRPSSLRSRDLETMAVHGGVDDLLLRPLSAKLLPPTLPERNGWVDRELLHGWHGRGRREPMRLAHEWSLLEEPGHAAGCSLLQETYARRLKKLLRQNANPPLWELRTLALGRHFSWDDGLHLVVARNAAEGAMLKEIWQSADSPDFIYLEPLNFRGPSALCGTIDPHELTPATTFLLKFGKDMPAEPRLSVCGCSGVDSIDCRSLDSTSIPEHWG